MTDSRRKAILELREIIELVQKGSPVNKLTPKTAPLVIVRWRDPKFKDLWNEEPEEFFPARVVTAGFLIETGSDFIRVASTYDEDEGEWATVHVINTTPPDIEVILKERP